MVPVAPGHSHRDQHPRAHSQGQQEPPTSQNLSHPSPGFPQASPAPTLPWTTPAAAGTSARGLGAVRRCPRRPALGRQVSCLGPTGDSDDIGDLVHHRHWTSNMYGFSLPRGLSLGTGGSLLLPSAFVCMGWPGSSLSPCWGPSSTCPRAVVAEGARSMGSSGSKRSRTADEGKIVHSSRTREKKLGSSRQQKQRRTCPGVSGVCKLGSLSIF